MFLFLAGQTEFVYTLWYVFCCSYRWMIVDPMFAFSQTDMLSRFDVLRLRGFCRARTHCVREVC